MIHQSLTLLQAHKIAFITGGPTAVETASIWHVDREPADWLHVRYAFDREIVIDGRGNVVTRAAPHV